MTRSITDSLTKWRECQLPEEAYEPLFASFIFENNLHHMLAYYQKHDDINKHAIRMIGDEPGLLVEGQPLSWSRIQAITGVSEGALKAKDWSYTYDRGYVQENISVWDEPRPIRQGKSTGGYTFNICSALDKFSKSSVNKVHCYMEIVKPDGLVYNLGLWAPEEFNRIAISSSCSTGVGNFCNPDCFEFMGRRVVIHKTPVTITENQANQLFARMKAWKNDGLAFNWTRDNCAELTARAAAEIGIQIPINRSLIGFFLPDRVNHALDSMAAKMPRVLSRVMSVIIKIIFLVPVILANAIRCIFFGAAKGVKIKVNGQERRVAHISSIYDFFFEGIHFNLPGAVLAWQKTRPSTVIWQ